MLQDNDICLNNCSLFPLLILYIQFLFRSFNNLKRRWNKKIIWKGETICLNSKRIVQLYTSHKLKISLKFFFFFLQWNNCIFHFCSVFWKKLSILYAQKLKLSEGFYFLSTLEKHIKTLRDIIVCFSRPFYEP